MAILMSQFFGAVFGFLAVAFGAFGAHALKKRFTPDQLSSFETGVKYQMYHALLLLILSFNLSFSNSLDSIIVGLITIGTFLFSFSIYGLCLTGAAGNKWKWLGPVTPLGGLLLASGWACLVYLFIKDFVF